MGEAKRRRDARLKACASGAVVPPPEHCPACGSKYIHRMPEAEIPPRLRALVGGDLEYCDSCHALWEPFPAAGYIEDPVCAEPCSNCAFRAGSPEQLDKAGWARLLEALRPSSRAAWSSGRFYCHKHMAIDQTKGPGNFLYPEKPVMVDGVPLLNPADGSPVMMKDVAKMRTCSGFLRMVWAHTAKKMGSSEATNPLAGKLPGG